MFPSYSRFVLAVMLLPALAVAQPFHRFDSASFELSVSQIFGQQGQALLVVNISIPNRRLVFFRKAERFEAVYRVYMDLRDAGGKYIRGDVWEESQVVTDYGETKSPSAVSTSRRIFQVTPGEYGIRVTIEVVNTSLKYNRAKNIRIVGRGSGKLEVTDPLFSAVTPRAGIDKPPVGELVFTVFKLSDSEGIRINPDGVYADFSVWPRITYNLAGPTASGQDEYIVSMRVMDMGGKVILYNRRRLEIGESGHLVFCYDFNVDDFPIGDFEVSTVVEVPAAGKKGSARGRFTVLLNRGLLEKHFADTLEILSIIADSEELAELKKAPPQERVAAWLRFWDRRRQYHPGNVNVELEEFLHRVKHVLESYSRGSYAGWKTDMGRVYIRYGEPDEIVDRQGRSLGTNYQLWYYFSRNIVYVFEDTVGTGDYRLLTTRSI